VQVPELSVEVAVAQRSAENEVECGDCAEVVRNGETLVAVADGLGHGPDAAEAARTFCRYVRENASLGLEDIVMGASIEMSRTRGAACGLARIDAAQGLMSFVGVGNIDVQAVSTADIHPICLPGIVGQRVRKLQVFTYELHPGDLIAIYSDGISSRFELETMGHLGVQEMADAILEEHGKSHDDATCVVIRIGR
jgi:serine/threonine protein phosphatase PrpC